MSSKRFTDGRVGIVANVSKPHTAKATRAVIAALDERSIPWRLETATASSVNMADAGRPFAELLSDVAWLIVIGGDGTILQTARNVAKHDLPLLGVNPGQSLGFMTDTPLEDVPKTLDDICGGNYDIVERSTIQAVLLSGDEDRGEQMPPALNDVTFTHGAQARLITLEVKVNDKYFCTYEADGLIFATATGSTAHSMSAGGPVLFPSTEAMVLTPICPHTLSNRPIVLPRGFRIEVRKGESEREVHLDIDGQVIRRLEARDRVMLHLSSHCVKFIHSRRRSFVDVLQKKLHWRGHLGTEPGTPNLAQP